ncbi:MAG: hypothetical protein KGL39_55410, partial [Patescibacteria group bacterium]|nr:hypothetical protein [Patescibacteria group bacterium]
LLHVVDQRVARWDSLGIIDEMFTIQTRYNPEIFFVEDGQIWKALSPMLFKEMQKRDIWINVKAIPPVKDKASRGRSLQRRHRAGGMRFDKEASWYPGYEAELLRFTGRGEAILDDQFDSTALLSKGFDLLPELVEDDFQDEQELEFDHHSRDLKQVGRSVVTGY